MKITKKEFIMMLGGMFLMSAAVYYEMMPNNLVLGSLSGLVLVLVKIIPLPVSTINPCNPSGFYGRDGGKNVGSARIFQRRKRNSTGAV